VEVAGVRLRHPSHSKRGNPPLRNSIEIGTVIRTQALEHKELRDTETVEKELNHPGTRRNSAQTGTPELRNTGTRLNRDWNCNKDSETLEPRNSAETGTHLNDAEPEETQQKLEHKNSKRINKGYSR
jgi:hypothetical protein